ncbi:type II toxin-antitoxin system RelE/ParE family toxin [Longimicrobium sp.]|uniref:type II toxin-antitoxin system RelE/ParE family toxin n=1 Tax=Longimicrobium sp. TaxID=2029185 RepID=UPI002E339684|nr:type II toxin-antitoxin system RelE/ParE family toxin [Longimicrobium sp.]HEX6042041.1 type II toxin-antitoxin system RelE/ParE family toxin [Longimicrobium sp.]
MRKIEFYQSGAGRSPVREFLDGLSAREARRVWCLLDAVRTLDSLPADYQEALGGPGELWELRAEQGARMVRLLACTRGARLLVLVCGVGTRSRGVSGHEIALAQRRRRDHWERSRRDG